MTVGGYLPLSKSWGITREKQPLPVSVARSLLEFVIANGIQQCPELFKVAVVQQGTGGWAA